LEVVGHVDGGGHLFVEHHMVELEGLDDLGGGLERRGFAGLQRSVARRRRAPRRRVLEATRRELTAVFADLLLDERGPARASATDLAAVEASERLWVLLRRFRVWRADFDAGQLYRLFAGGRSLEVELANGPTARPDQRLQV